MMVPDDIRPRNVLVIAYYFPPMGLSGVQRTMKFVKYLPLYRWRPTVLTVEPRGYLAKDETLVAELASPEIRIVRTHAAGPGRLFSHRETVGIPPEWIRKLLSRLSDTVFFPDNKIGWKWQAVRKALELHREAPFDLVYATAPPFTDFLIGRSIKAKLNKPLVLDYRDPWVENPFKFYPTPLHKWRNVALERKALRASSHIVTTNRRVKELLIQRQKFLTYHDIDIISHGFDPEDFSKVSASVPDRVRKTRPRSSKMRVTYSGIFWEDRVPDYFLEALHDLFQEKPKLRGRIEAVFVGNFREENQKLVSRFHLEDSVRIMGYLPHHECIAELLAADVLWLIAGDDLGSPGKMYEYIGARKPILGCVPEGYLRATILEAGGRVVAPNDVQGIKKALEEYFLLFERNQLKGPRSDIIDKYDRVALTGSLVKVFESLLV